MKIQSIKLLTALILLFLINSCSDENNSAEKQKKPQDKNTNQTSQNIDLLYNAALDGDIEVVKNYLETGFDVNQPNQDKQSLLMLSGFNGHTDLCEYLIKSGAHIEARETNGRTALMFASTGPFPKTVELLLQNDANPNSIDNLEHFTPLMHAAAEGHIEVVKILLDHGADPSLKDIDGDTAESFAVQKGHSKVAKLLKEHK
ncbi:MAG: ankyrin repeat domain-containing protein [Melioribacteraceae bacterium]|nr:ankyrin repeat domain-containing protein [Melioribacteraceae bacterium]